MKYDLPGEPAVEADGPIRTVVLNRPDELNAVNLPLHWALADVWRQLAADPEAKVVILTGAGRAFSTGGDLDWIALRGAMQAGFAAEAVTMKSAEHRERLLALLRNAGGR